MNPNDQLAMLKQFFPQLDEEQIMAHVGLIGLMINGALQSNKVELEKELEPLYEVKFERDVEKQIKQVREKYKDDPLTFTDLENEVRERLEQVPPKIRAKHGSAETIFLALRGERLPSVLKSKLEAQAQQTRTVEDKKEDAFVESGGNTSVQSPPVDVSKMSSDQLEALIKSTKK